MPEFPQAASSVIASQVHGDLEQPNAHARLAPKGSTPLIGLQKALLGQCLRGVGVSEHAEHNSVDTLLVRPYKWRKVIQCSHPKICFLLNGNQNRGSFILHHARSLLHKDESTKGRFTWDVARASRPLWRGHPFAALRAGSARALLDLAFSLDLPSSPDVKATLGRERDAPATAGETPALHPKARLCCQGKVRSSYS